MVEKTSEHIQRARIVKALREKHDSLDLSNLGLTDIWEGFWQLSNLSSLNLSGNKLTKLSPEIGKFTNLRVLNLRNNEIDSLPRELFTLNKLEVLLLGQAFAKEKSMTEPERLFELEIEESLNLPTYAYMGERGNYLSEIDKNISNLRNLKKLDLSGNPIQNIPVEIFSLEKLRELDISYTQISTIPDEITKLSFLEFLGVANTRLNSFPISICKLKKLRVLYIWGHKNIKELPSAISNLNKLQVLQMRDCGVSNIPASIENLGDLKVLNLLRNEIKSLPREIKKIDGLKVLMLSDNKLQIPPEIIESYYHPKSILIYYFSLSNQNKLILGETKVLIVGQGSVGKTSTVKRLIDGRFDDKELKTEGIAIIRTQVDFQSGIENQSSKIKLNLWDFGGQEIMHATHQFFLTKRSLYLLVLDSRLTQEENRVEYWLKIIQSFGGESPVLIVGNKIDQHPLDIDRTGLQKKYPNIVGILETSAATGAGIEALKAAITEQVNNLPHVRDLLPETWFTVKTKLEGLGRETNFITHDKYIELCAENEVSDETSQRTLIGFLHDLGVVLHFQDDPRLEALGILNPQWVTNGVYKILNSHALFQNKGELTVAMLDEILNLPEYPRGKRLFIVDMMKKFELCYDLETDKSFLVPDLLPKDEPPLTFNGIPAFEYAYPVLPSSVITRFIVRMNQKIDDGFVWRTGVLLKIGDNHALVKADIEDKKITIAIDGLEYTRREAIFAIRYELGEIHKSIKGLNPQQRVPIPSAPKAEPLEYEYLLMLEREGDETCRVKDGSRLVTVNVRQLLSGIESESQRRSAPEGGVIIYGDVHTGGGDFSGRDKSISTGDRGVVVSGKIGGHLIAGDDNQVIQDSYNKITSAEIDPELKQAMQLLIEAVAAMNKELPQEKAAEIGDDLGELVQEVTRPTPRQKWYSVSIDGLIKAAENLDELGEPVIKLAGKVLSLLLGRTPN